MREKLIKARGNKSQEEMAKIFGVKQQTYSSWETGRSKPLPSIMKQMEVYFSIPMEELFFDLFNNEMLLKSGDQSLQKTG
jgi:Predicted transcriptional regulators